MPDQPVPPNPQIHQPPQFPPELGQPIAGMNLVLFDTGKVAVISPQLTGRSSKPMLLGLLELAKVVILESKIEEKQQILAPSPIAVAAVNGSRAQ